MKPRLAGFRTQAGEAIGQFCEELHEADCSAKAAIEIVRQQIPIPTRRPTVRQLAYRACLAAERPVTIDELVARARQDGYTTESKDPRRYARRVLRADRRLKEVEGGWDLAVRLRVEERPVVLC